MQLDLAAILLRLGLGEEAERRLGEATEIAEDEAILVQAADLALRHNLWQQGLAILRRNVALRPENAAAHWNLAHLLSEAWHMEEALEALARAEALAPQPGAGPMRASIAARQGEADTALQLFLAQVEAGDTALASGAAMSALYADSIDAAAVAALHRRLFARLGEGAREVASFRNGREPGRPLRVGMVTPDLHHQHPVNIFMQPVLARWDGRQMPISLYCTGISHDEETRQARGRVAHAGHHLLEDGLVHDERLVDGGGRDVRSLEPRRLLAAHAQDGPDAVPERDQGMLASGVARAGRGQHPGEAREGGGGPCRGWIGSSSCGE
jgi:predicted O-linked N-acetylglucosamine transferase (SPINDLY family)